MTTGHDSKRAALEQRGRRLLKQLAKFARDVDKAQTLKRKARSRIKFFRCKEQCEQLKKELTIAKYGDQSVSKQPVE